VFAWSELKKSGHQSMPAFIPSFSYSLSSDFISHDSL
jgi:hypothetical protein